MEELISVVVPIYKVEKYLPKCLESIINQTYKNLEIILVDDGSPDACGAICDEYAKKDSRIKVIHKENGGLSAARNDGIKIATGKYIGFIDSDDFIDKKMYEKLYHNMIKNEADISICKMHRVIDGEELTFEEYEEEVKEVSFDDIIISTIFSDDYGNYAMNKLYKKSLFSNVEYPVNKKFEDIPTTCKLFYNAKKIVMTNYDGYIYLVGRPGSITSNNKNPQTLIDNLEAYVERYRFLQDKCPNIKGYLDSEYIKAVNGIFEVAQACKIEGLTDNEYFKKQMRNAVELFKKVDKNVLFEVMNNYKIAILLLYMYDEGMYMEHLERLYSYRKNVLKR